MIPDAASQTNALDLIAAYLGGIPQVESLVGQELRSAIDEVIDGERTGRFSVEELEKTEKTYIGTRVEIRLRHALKLGRGRLLDHNVQNHEFDTKFSLSGSWMIPREAVNKICMLVAANDDLGTFQLGLLLTCNEVLTQGGNRDGKRGVSAFGRSKIRWIIERGQLPKNFVLSLTPSIRDHILSQPSAKARMAALFRNVHNTIIPRTAIKQIAKTPGDPLKRAREAKALLAPEGLVVLCANYASDRVEFIRHGFKNFATDDWLVVKE